MRTVGAGMGQNGRCTSPVGGAPIEVEGQAWVGVEQRCGGEEQRCGGEEQPHRWGGGGAAVRTQWEGGEPTLREGLREPLGKGGAARDAVGAEGGALKGWGRRRGK